MKITDVVKVPVNDLGSLEPLDVRLQNVCDVRWAAGYGLASAAVVVPIDNERYFVLIFQPRHPAMASQFPTTSPPDTVPLPAAP